MKISDLQEKTIINISDGRNLGRISDLEIDEFGQVISFYAIPKKFFLRLFSSNKETVFTIKDISKIGKDVILVQIN